MDFIQQIHRLFPVSLACAAAFCVATPISGVSKDRPDAFTLVGNSCLDCHDEVTQKGGMRLDDLDPISEDPHAMETWLRVYDQVASGAMPPKKNAFSEEEIEEFTSVLGDELALFDACASARNALRPLHLQRAGDKLRCLTGRSTEHSDGLCAVRALD